MRLLMEGVYVPVISVIMGIYNCEDTLSEAIECILRQTYVDWELIMCDDGSSDRTVEIAEKYVKQYSDKMILLKNKQNCGLNHTLNKCLKKTSGEYIARMDADDLCANDRFEKELRILQNESQIAFVSTNMSFFDENGIWGCSHTKEYPEKIDFLRGTPFCHAPCMVRREAYLAVNGYSEEKRLLRVEDYHLWMKMYKHGYRGKNMVEALYQMRDDRNAYKRRKFKYRVNEAYVKALAIKELKLPLYGYVYVLKPIIVGLLPSSVYNNLHKKGLERSKTI